MDSFKNLNEIAEDDDDDEDDEDYVPDENNVVDKEEGESSVSDQDDDSDDDDEADADNTDKIRTKKMKTSKRGRKRKASLSKNDNSENCAGDSKKELSAEEKKRKADNLWAELCESSSNKSEPKDEPKLESKSETIKPLEKTYDFAGETVVVKELSKNVASISATPLTEPTKSTIPARRSGLTDLISNLGKKSKIGTLQKSKLDWDSFKKEEGIEDDLKQATLSKDGYVERQAFLSRADHRQFEIEKTIRSKIRKPPQ